MAKGGKNKYGVPIGHSGKIPCRCKRCDARRSLAKYPEEYVRWPTCHIPGCGKWEKGGGKFHPSEMRVDRIRLRARFDKTRKLYEVDSGKQCRCFGHPRKHPMGKVNELYACLHPKPRTKAQLKECPF